VRRFFSEGNYPRYRSDIKKDLEIIDLQVFFVSALRRNLNPWFYQGSIKSLGKIKPPCYGGDGLATASQVSSKEVLNNEK
jgi:hypothetical protein